MKKNILLLLIFIIFGLTYVFCEDKPVPTNNALMYVKYESVWFYNDAGDLEKAPKDVKNKKVFYFGNKVTVINNKKIKDKIYLGVQMPDGSKYWAPMDYLTTKFVVITDIDIKCFSQPDDSYVNKIKLQPGFLGFFVKEKDNYINVDFNFYAPKKPEDKPTWVGNVWIKTVKYTDNIRTAEQASYLVRAYNDLYGKTTNVDSALKKLKDAINNVSDETPITYVIQDLISQLEAGVKINNTETTIGNYYTPSVSSLRFRDTPSVDGKYIRTLQQGEKLKLLEKGNEDVINGIKGYWCKFETSSGEAGWAFDAYMNEVK